MILIEGEKEWEMNMCNHKAANDKYLGLFIILLWPIQGSDSQLSFVYMVTDRKEHSTDILRPWNLKYILLFSHSCSSFDLTFCFAFHLIFYFCFWNEFDIETLRWADIFALCVHTRWWRCAFFLLFIDCLFFFFDWRF